MTESIEIGPNKEKVKEVSIRQHTKKVVKGPDGWSMFFSSATGCGVSNPGQTS